MIRRLDRLQGRNIYENTALAKLNEVIDAVNELQKAFESFHPYLKYKDLNKIQDDPYAEPEPAENVQPDAKSRPVNVQDVDELEQAEKWVGKLCWFSQIYECHQHIAILKRISESGLYVTDDGELHYEYCEPVKPDDDIIYRGE